MGLAYTNGPIRYGTVPASPPEDFIAAIDAMVLDAGWTKLGPYEDNGFEYQIQSPQALLARCRIWFPDDAAWPNCLAIQFFSAIDPDIQGMVHHFVAGFENTFEGDDRGFTHYVVWVNMCQLFIGAVHPRSWEKFPRAVQGGIPFAAGAVTGTPECQAQTPAPPETTQELWWSAGDDSGVYDEISTLPGSMANFRNSYFCQKFSFCHNSQLVNAAIGNPTIPTENLALQVAIVRSAIDWNALTISWPLGFVYPDMSPLANNPLLVYNATIYGELWDAVLISRAMDLEEPEQIYESDANRTTNWRNYMNSAGIFISNFTVRNEGSCASILLLDEDQPDEPIPSEVNVAY